MRIFPSSLFFFSADGAGGAAPAAAPAAAPVAPVVHSADSFNNITNKHWPSMQPMAPLTGTEPLTGEKLAVWQQQQERHNKVRGVVDQWRNAPRSFELNKDMGLSASFDTPEEYDKFLDFSKKAVNGELTPADIARLVNFDKAIAHASEFGSKKAGGSVATATAARKGDQPTADRNPKSTQIDETDPMQEALGIRDFEKAVATAGFNPKEVADYLTGKK